MKGERFNSWGPCACISWRDTLSTVLNLALPLFSLSLLYDLNKTLWFFFLLSSASILFLPHLSMALQLLGFSKKKTTLDTCSCDILTFLKKVFYQVRFQFVTSTFYYCHDMVCCLYRQLLTKHCLSARNHLMETHSLSFLFLANLQKICFTLQWKPGWYLCCSVKLKYKPQNRIILVPLICA